MSIESFFRILSPRYCPLLALVLAAGTMETSEGFLIQTRAGRAGTVQQTWHSSHQGISFIIHSAGSDNLPAATTHRLLRESFKVWEDVPTAAIRFVDQGLTDSLQPSLGDRQNLLIFDEKGRWLQAPPETGVIAVTRINANPVTGEILDADIIFNGRDFQFVDGSPDSGRRINLKDVAVHEIGHLLGLDHTPLDGPPEIRPTMNPFNHGGSPGSSQTQDPDDQVGLSVLYPTAAFRLEEARISGRVSDVDDAPLFGSHIVAENLDTGAIYSTVSGAYPKTGDRGHYILRGLSAGSYRLFIAPIQGAITEDNFGGIFRDFFTDFPVEYYDNKDGPERAQTIPLKAGQQIGDIDFNTGFILPGHPLVSALSEPANSPDTQGPYPVHIRAANASRVVMFYRIGENGSVNRVTMRRSAPGTYTAEIPGQGIGSRIFYQIQALNNEGNSTFYPHPNQWLDFEIVALTGSPLAFTAIRDEGVISVVDTGDKRELARIPVGGDPIQVLLAADGSRLYVSNLTSSEIVVIATANFQILDRLSVDDQPLDMAQAPDGRTIYVTHSGASSLTAIDVASGATTPLPLNRAASGPYGIAVAAHNQTIYVTDLDNDQVLVLDTRGRVLERIPVADRPRSLALAPEGSKLFATSFVGSRLTIIDVVNSQVSNTIALPVRGTFAVAPTLDGRKVYLTAHEDGVVVIVDAVKETFLKTLRTGANPRAISLSPSGDRAFVTCAASHEVYVIDTAKDEIVGTYGLGKGPRGIAITPSPETPTAIELEPALPDAFVLHPNFPNPFNASTRIVYTIPGSIGTGLRIDLGVYDVLGRKVRTLVHQQRQGPGTYWTEWDGKDERGNDVASGVYLLLLHEASGRAVQKMLLVR